MTELPGFRISDPKGEINDFLELVIDLKYREMVGKGSEIRMYYFKWNPKKEET